MFSITELFEGIVSAESASEFVFHHPVLLSTAWQRELALRVKSEEQKDTLLRLMHVSGSMQQNPRNYPIGPGPIEQIYGQARRGEITQRYALDRAASEDMFSLLSPFYVRLLSINAQKAARERDWRAGVGIEQLILAALDARREQIAVDQAEMDFIAVVHWLDIVTRAVGDVPDGTLFRDALRRGEQLKDVIQDPGAFYAPAEILSRLGILHLDPYIAGRSSSNYEQQWLLWQARLDQQRSREAQGAASEEDRIPRPVMALPQAVAYLRLAAPQRAGVDRGLTLKALMEATMWARAVRAHPDRSEVEGWANEALQLIPEQGYESERAVIDNLLHWNAAKLDGDQEPESQLVESPLVDSPFHESAQQMLQKPMEQWLAEESPRKLIESFVQTAAAVRRTPELALQLWQAVGSLVQDEGEAVRSAYYSVGSGYVTRALAPGDLPGSGFPFANRLAAVQALDVEDYTRAAMLFALGVGSGTTNEEEAGTEALRSAFHADVRFSMEFEDLIEFAKSSLLHDAAVSSFNAGQGGESARLYMQSAASKLQLRMPEAAWDDLDSAIDVTIDGDPVALGWVVGYIGDVSAGLEQQLGDLVTGQLQMLYRQVHEKLLAGGRLASFLPLLYVWQAAKGNVFSHALMSGTPLDWLAGEDARNRERRLEELARQTAPERSRIFTEETLLTAYVSSGEQHGGETPGERLQNLQIAFDTEVNRQLVSNSRQDWYVPLTDKALQESLGPSTVLVAQYAGSLAGALTVFTLFATREDLGMTAGQVPDLLPGVLVFENKEENRLASSPFAPYVEKIRTAVQQEPGPRCASDEALDGLRASLVDFYGAGLGEKLEAFRKQGKTHLCICPQGPFHFFPYHLMGDEDRPLAEQWAITYTPNLRLLAADKKAAAHEGDLIAVGLDFAANNPHGLPALSGPEGEANEIAKATGCTALTGTDATRSAVVDALQKYRRVHIATHGELEVSAPSFQCLYLSPDASGDVLSAYEILRLDLRGVDLVTLSACETALGRFDISDNLRGVPANLLLAGVSTVIGTLWPVETNTAERFFTSLYGHLRGSATKGDAFHAAQIETRQTYSQYRDWGAFYLVGAVV